MGVPCRREVPATEEHGDDEMPVVLGPGSAPGCGMLVQVAWPKELPCWRVAARAAPVGRPPQRRHIASRADSVTCTAPQIAHGRHRAAVSVPVQRGHDPNAPMLRHPAVPGGRCPRRRGIRRAKLCADNTTGDGPASAAGRGTSTSGYGSSTVAAGGPAFGAAFRGLQHPPAAFTPNRFRSGPRWRRRGMPATCWQPEQPGGATRPAAEHAMEASGVGGLRVATGACWHYGVRGRPARLRTAPVIKRLTCAHELGDRCLEPAGSNDAHLPHTFSAGLARCAAAEHQALTAHATRTHRHGVPLLAVGRHRRDPGVHAAGASLLSRVQAALTA